MAEIKLKRNRKKIFPHTVIVKISEDSYQNIMILCEKFMMSKSEILREIIEYGVHDKFKENK